MTAKIQDPMREEMLAYLESQFPPSVYGDETDCDFEAAMYWFAVDYHSGMFSNLYAVSCNSRFNPGPCCSGPERDSCEETMYQSLKFEFAGIPFPEDKDDSE